MINFDWTIIYSNCGAISDERTFQSNVFVFVSVNDDHSISAGLLFWWNWRYDHNCHHVNDVALFFILLQVGISSYIELKCNYRIDEENVGTYCTYVVNFTPSSRWENYSMCSAVILKRNAKTELINYPEVFEKLPKLEIFHIQRTGSSLVVFNSRTLLHRFVDNAFP